MTKIISVTQAVDKIRDGMTLMIGGFLANGSPLRIIDLLAESGVKQLTIICNDTSFQDKGIGKLVANRQVKKLYTSHIGTNPHSSEQMNEGSLDIEFCPQGTLAERIRCGGNGLGGFLTPTGLGTIVAEGKKVVEVNGREYLLELPLRADIALIASSLADEEGNLVYRGTSQNFNPLMATAADVVIAEAAQVVPAGNIAAENVHTPAIFTDYIV